MEVPLEKLWPRSVKIHPEGWLKVLCVDNKRPILPDYIPDELRRVIELAWDSNPEVRPSAEEILNALEQCIAVVARDV